MELRARPLNACEVRTDKDYVLYRISRNRRVEANHALVFAAELANRFDLPLVAYESLRDGAPETTERHCTFVMEGARDLAKGLRHLRVGYIFDAPGDRWKEVLGHAAAIVADDYPELLSGPAESFAAAAYAVESSCIVPPASIEVRAYAAYSIRPKIRKLLPQFLKPVRPVRLKRRFGGKNVEPQPLVMDGAVGPSTLFRGGRAAAERQLERFLETRLHRYAREKNEPAAHATSELSPHLHFGHISALEVALAVREYADRHKLAADEFLEELIVRRELAFNFVRYAKRVDSLEELPAWAQQTLNRHRRDRRDPLYTGEQFEGAETGDDLWNATQKELLLRGKIHGYYRMYWGKKIIEWSRTPEEALATMIRLHDRYALDGRDPNTYANILWCFGLHDRPWQRRPIFGTVRYMSRAGMDRKTDTAAYIREIEDLERTGKERIQ